MNKKIDLSIVVPVYNEEKNIDIFFKRTIKSIPNKLEYEIIFCLDPSTDNSEKIINDLCRKYSQVRCILFSRRFGQPTAVMAGILNSIGKSCVIIDADLQDPPELIPNLYKKLVSGFDVVYAKRKSRKGETIIKKIVANIGYKFINKISNIDIPKDTGDFRIINRRVIEELRKLPERHGFLRGLVSYVGFKQTQLEYDRDERKYGHAKYNKYFGSITIGFNGIIGFSNFLLKLNLLIGMLVAFVSFLVAMWVVFNTLFMDTTYALGIPTIIVLITFLGGIQLIAIGILGEYIGRIYDEVKNRPRFIINKFLNFDKIIDDGSN